MTDEQQFIAAIINAMVRGTPPDVIATLAAAKFATDPDFDKPEFLKKCETGWILDPNIPTNKTS
jgi:hypothetical protein